MLRQLSIENVAVIEKADIEFKKGFNVLTGETGAGKSILIDSINAILGNRTSKEIVRSGTEKAVIWAQFDDISASALSQLEEGGYPYDGSLLLYREVTADGKSICRVNNKPATAAIVREICVNLVNIHGQHDNQALLDPARHINILDNFGELNRRLSEYTEVYSRLIETKRELDSIVTDENEKQRKLELLLYQADEIEKAKLVPGEEEQLEELKKKIHNSSKLVEGLGTAVANLDGGEDTDGAKAAIFEASRALDTISSLDSQIESAASRLNELYYSLNDISSDLNDYLSSLDFDPTAADETEERLDLIYQLKRKYGDGIDAILAYAESAREQISSIETSDVRRKELTVQYNLLLEKARAIADQLTAERKEAFERFRSQIRSELEFLNMPGVNLTLDCQSGQLTRLGQDTIQFFISTNPGEPPKPLSKVASGGELSRIMLAIKNALADKDDIDTLIFDEIDTGVSGSGAQKIAQKLKQASATRQIICVTHSAPIAAYADSHLYISKSVSFDRTFTTVTELAGDERVHELARIISGDNITEISLSNAKEMLFLAQK